jgi:hypothetical protein
VESVLGQRNGGGNSIWEVDNFKIVWKKTKWNNSKQFLFAKKSTRWIFSIKKELGIENWLVNLLKNQLSHDPTDI